MPSKLDVNMTLPENQNTVQEAPAAIIQKTGSSNDSPHVVTRRHQINASSLAVDKLDAGLTSGMNETGKEKEKKNSDKPKRKIPWYNALYPSYKSRSEDFKRIFKDIVPPEERLIVDYSCAIQKDILVHGRLYASQNYLCFYANIFRWETMMSVQWKDVTAITKEKTALVIPNAILIQTGSEKHFLTSFGTRDKTYLMLFRVWQHALMDKSLSSQEIWQWVHACYGDELGLTSDDDDYIPPNIDAVMSDSDNKTKDDFSKTEKLNFVGGEKIVGNSSPQNDKFGNENLEMEAKSCFGSEPQLLKSSLPDMLPTDVSDNTDSDHDEPDRVVKCLGLHDGRLMASVTLPISADQLFSTLFTNSEFCKSFHELRKNTDVSFTSWETDSVPNQKIRKGSLIVPINQPVGPKTSQISETQVLLNYSVPGNLYAIDAESNNAGIPYADSFYISSHFCIIRSPKLSNESTLHVYCQIKYRKSVWGLVKSFIEKNCWSGLEEYYNALVEALREESEKSKLPDSLQNSNKRKMMRKRRSQIVKNGCELTQQTSFSTNESPKEPLPVQVPLQSSDRVLSNSEKLSWAILTTLIFLLFINVILYYKLWSLEDASYRNKASNSLEFDLKRFATDNPEELLKLFRNEETVHNVEINNLNQIIKSIASLLHEAEESLEKLDERIQHVINKQILAVLKTSLAKRNSNDNNKVLTVEDIKL